MKLLIPTLPRLFACLLLLGAGYAQDKPRKMPREDVVHVPAVGDRLCVSNLFQSNMVIQRDKPVTIWGWAAPGEMLTVTFAGRSVAGTAAPDRSWMLELPPLPASATPQTMTIAGKDHSLELENILVGDVWILGGQSNMEFELAKVDDGMLEIVSANFPEVRLLTVPQGDGFDSVKSFERLHEWSDWSGRHFRKGDWDVCSPESVSEFSAIGYVFGRRLHMATGIPIGLIDASRGGTTVEAWTPEDVVRGIDQPETKSKLVEWDEKIASYDPQVDLQKRIENYERKNKQLAEEGKPLPPDSKPPSDLRPGPVADQNRPGYCYAGMIRPLEGLAVKGVVFHQGFNNCFDGSAGARMYYQLFGEMITAWRSAFRDDQLPFCIISLCTAGAPQTRDHFLEPMYDAGPLIREAQYRTFRDLRDAGDQDIGFVSTFDLRKSWYHPQIKVPAGERTAKWALATQYEILSGRDGPQFWLPPSIEKIEIAEGTIRLTMSTQITVKDDSEPGMTGFAIAGEDRRFYPAEIQYFTDGSVDNRNRPQYQRDKLVLSSPFVPDPLHYRYAWARNPMANLCNSRQIPLATQRSDDWFMEETPIKFPSAPGTDPKNQSRQLGGKIRKELGLGDTERRILEAEATLAELKAKFLADKEAWEQSKAKDEERLRAATQKAESE